MSWDAAGWTGLSEVQRTLHPLWMCYSVRVMPVQGSNDIDTGELQEDCLKVRN